MRNSVGNPVLAQSALAGMLAAHCVLSGCGPSIGRLRAYVNSEDYGKAVAEAAGDAEMQTELAALVLERTAAADDTKASELVDSLGGAGGPGKRALKRLVEESKEPAASLAKIALNRLSRPNDNELESYLGHTSSDVRASASRAWAAQLEAEFLTKLLLDKDSRVRKWAADGMCRRSRENGAGSTLKDALRLDPEPKVRAAAAKCSGALGDDAVLLLKAALKDDNLGVRLAAIQGLFALTGETGRSIVEDLAKGPIDEMAVVAAAELARAGSALGKDRLVAALSDERVVIRQAAMLQLDRSVMPNRDDILVRMLDDGALEVELLAASMLAKEKEFAPAAVKTLKKIVGMSVTRSAEARDMLAELGDEASLKQVKKILENSRPDEVIAVLNRVQRATALTDVFVKLMAAGSGAVRLAAARAVLACASRVHK